jgi:hypothetical protein
MKCANCKINNHLSIVDIIDDYICMNCIMKIMYRINKIEKILQKLNL